MVILVQAEQLFVLKRTHNSPKFSLLRIDLNNSSSTTCNTQLLFAGTLFDDCSSIHLLLACASSQKKNAQSVIVYNWQHVTLFPYVDGLLASPSILFSNQQHQMNQIHIAFQIASNFQPEMLHIPPSLAPSCRCVQYAMLEKFNAGQLEYLPAVVIGTADCEILLLHQGIIVKSLLVDHMPVEM